LAVDFSIATRVAEYVVTFFLGWFLNRLVERRARLTVFYGHVGTFQMGPPPNQPNLPNISVNTHTVVIRNAGSIAAHNVRVPHTGLLRQANIHVWVDPGIHYSTNVLPGGQEELLFPILVPKQQVTISYLYFPPITFLNINLPVRCDEGLATVLNVLPTPQPPRWVRIGIFFLAAIGIVTLLYGLVELILWAGNRLGYF
jgi:hypothetical protein